MKRSKLALIAGTLTLGAILAAGCTQEPISSELVTSGQQTVSGSNESSWNTQEEYGDATYSFLGETVAISLIEDESSLCYIFYNIQQDYPMETLSIEKNLWSWEDLDQELLGTLYEKDLNNDGVNEYGVPLRDGSVLWYEYQNGLGFYYVDTGNPDNTDSPFPGRVGAGLSEVYKLADNFEVQFSYFGDQSSGGYSVKDSNDDHYYGPIEILSDSGYVAQDLDRSGDECFIIEDIDGDHVAEVGLPLINGNILWYRYDSETEGFTFFGEEAVSSDHSDASTILMDALGDKMKGKAIISTGTEVINGVTCELFSYGVNTPEKFTTEMHFAVDPDGNIYVADILQGLEYVPYNP